MEASDLASASNGLEYLPAFLTSLSIGLFVGLERERSPAAKAGLRTFGAPGTGALLRVQVPP